jgi:type II secretory pathway component PulJ
MTLIELLIGMMLGLVGTAALTALLRAGVRRASVAGVDAERRSRTAAAVDQLVRDVRVAGYDPTGAGIAAFAVVAADRVEIQADLDGNGTIDAARTSASASASRRAAGACNASSARSRCRSSPTSARAGSARLLRRRRHAPRPDRRGDRRRHASGRGRPDERTVGADPGRARPRRRPPGESMTAGSVDDDRRAAWIDDGERQRPPLAILLDRARRRARDERSPSSAARHSAAPARSRRCPGLVPRGGRARRDGRGVAGRPWLHDGPRRGAGSAAASGAAWTYASAFSTTATTTRATTREMSTHVSSCA